MSDLTADFTAMYGEGFAAGMELKESTPEIEDMLESLFGGMEPKLITLPYDVSLEQYCEAKALVMRCEGEEPTVSIFAEL